LIENADFMNRKLKAVIAWGLFMANFSVTAQSTNEETAVREVISRLFKGMELGDSAMVRSTFYDKNAILAAIFREKNNAPLIRRESIQKFLDDVGKPHGVLYEEIWNVNVQIDGDFAQVWCDYAFYIDKNFSHCGVDAFHLFRGKDGWKIFHIADTRRKTGCTIPEEIQEKHK
jgi:hypothetical protein